MTSDESRADGDSDTRQGAPVPRCVKILILGLVVGVIAGCGTGDGVDGAGSSGFDLVFESLVGYPWEEAGSHGLSEGAVSILAEARSRGYVTLSDLEQATQLTFACFDDAGIPWSRVWGTEYMGLPTIEFTFHAPVGTEEGDMEWFLLAQKCQDDNNLVVQTLYENQPDSLEMQGIWFDQNRRETVRRCLIDRGIVVADDADLAWFMHSSKEYLDVFGDSTCLELIVG